MYYIGRLDPISNRVGWLRTFEIDDDDTSETIDLTGASIVAEVRDPRTGAIVISATTANGQITIDDTGVFTINAPLSPSGPLIRAGEYEVGVTATINGVPVQLIIGTLPILDGVVTQL
jgi:hypothetical protein